MKRLPCAACKQLVDALYKKLQPAYIVLFGAGDVFPFQELRNELYHPENDPDEWVASDLPYACEAPFSKDAFAFINPTRVVGRLPDIPNRADLPYVATLIRNSIRQRPLPVKKYQDYFAVTAQVWTESTKETLQNLFGDCSKLLDCPDNGTGYPKKQLKPLSHFYNCHGAFLDPSYYGEQNDEYPVALNAHSDLVKKVAFGTVAVAECCYGAQVMDPVHEGKSIATTYLGENAVAFMGSSTIAYGPPSGQGLADLICQYYFQAILCGASSGRALLEARQKFLNASAPTLDAHELKTLAQFHILGDPALSPVREPVARTAASSVENRRLNLFTKGMGLGRTIQTPRKVEGNRGERGKEIAELVRRSGFSGTPEMVFETGPGAALHEGGKKP
jgi:hypothetical protein